VRRRINAAKENEEAYRFCLQGRRWLLEESGTAWDYIGYGRELRQVANNYRAAVTERPELLEAALEAYRTAWTMDSSPRARHTATVGAAAIHLDLGDARKALDLSIGVLAEDPANAMRRASSSLPNRSSCRAEVSSAARRLCPRGSA
jgi:hypothetical protein